MTRVMERELEYHSDPLTPAEKDVLRLLGLGNSNKEIASLRKRSEQTIKRQVAYVYRKLGVENRTRAVAVARERGLL
jgi:DNA-binding NarL/FixJ family response regulator